MACPPLHPSLTVLRVIWLKIKPSGFLAWGESDIAVLVHVPRVGSWSFKETLVGQIAALRCLYLLPFILIGGCCYGWGELREETGAYNSNENSQPWTGIFMKPLLGVGFHKNNRVTALSLSSRHSMATGAKENLERQHQWNYTEVRLGGYLSKNYHCIARWFCRAASAGIADS